MTAGDDDGPVIVFRVGPDPNHRKDGLGVLVAGPPDGPGCVWFTPYEARWFGLELAADPPPDRGSDPDPQVAETQAYAWSEALYVLAAAAEQGRLGRMGIGPDSDWGERMAVEDDDGSGWPDHTALPEWGTE